MIEYKGLTEEEVQKLIDKEIEDRKFIETYIQMIIRQRVFISEINRFIEESQGIKDLGGQPNNSA